MRIRTIWGAPLAAAFAVTAGLAGCDAGPSALPARDHSAAAVAAAGEAVRAAPREAAAERAEAPRFNGRPLWSSNSRYTAQENADYHFKRNGQDFGAETVDEFVAKAHDFVADPPRGAKTLTRENGDRLIYDPKSNTFAVATKAGAPRTMFHPDNGAAYWAEQVEREEKAAS